MLAWSEGTGARTSENQKSWLWRHCRRRAIYWLPDHPRKLVTLNPKLKSTGADATSFFPVGGCHRKQLGLKDFSPKVRTLYCSRLRSVAFTYDWSWRISVRQSTVAAISGLHCRALVMVSSSIRLTADCKIQRSGRRSERIDVWAESPRLSPLWLSASSSACHGLLIITVITPLLPGPARQKCQRTGSWRTRQLLTCRCVAMLLRSMQNTRRS